VIIIGVAIGSLILLPAAHWAVWALIPPLSPQSLAKTGHFVLVGGIDTYYERHGSGPPLILISSGWQPHEHLAIQHRCPEPLT